MNRKFKNTIYLQEWSLRAANSLHCRQSFRAKNAVFSFPIPSNQVCPRAVASLCCIYFLCANLNSIIRSKSASRLDRGCQSRPFSTIALDRGRQSHPLHTTTPDRGYQFRPGQRSTWNRGFQSRPFSAGILDSTLNLHPRRIIGHSISQPLSGRRAQLPPPVILLASFN